MLEYILATFVIVRTNRAGHMMGLAGTVSELFAKMLLSTKPYYVKGRKIVKIRYLMKIVIYLFAFGCNK